MPKISVIVPVYKVEDYLCRCVDSILAQDFTDFELFLVDDGSPDRCGEICDHYATKDARIQVIHKQNGGLSDARNAALDVASGEYISFIDSDDWVAPDFLSSMVTAIERHGADMAICNFVRAHENGNTEPMYVPATTETVLTDTAVFETLHQPSACNKVYKASIFNTLRYPVGKLYEDAFVYHDVLAQIKTLVYTGKDSYFYFQRAGSIMRTEYTPRFMDIVEACYLRAQKLDELGQTSLADEARLFVYSQVGVAHAHVNKRDAAAKARLKDVRGMFLDSYDALMASGDIPPKQKLRIRILKWLPWLHTQLFGKKMPINLGG